MESTENCASCRFFRPTDGSNLGIGNCLSPLAKAGVDVPFAVQSEQEAAISRGEKPICREEAYVRAVNAIIRASQGE